MPLEPEGNDSGYQLFMLGLSFYVIVAMAAQTFLPLAAETIRILDLADTAICGFFAFDFGRSFLRAENKGRYMVTWGWLDLLSSIPTIDLFRYGRAARIFRIIRVLRVIRAARNISMYAYTFHMRNSPWAALFLAIMLLIVGSIAIVHLEGAGDGNIRAAEDALWWTFVTITTVGYGDFYPVTFGGRIVALSLMTVGIGLFGIFTAVVAARFVENDQDETEQALARVERELAAVREELRSISRREANG